jgi:hypothetical protein
VQRKCCAIRRRSGRLSKDWRSRGEFGTDVGRTRSFGATSQLSPVMPVDRDATRPDLADKDHTRLLTLSVVGLAVGALAGLVGTAFHVALDGAERCRASSRYRYRVPAPCGRRRRPPGSSTSAEVESQPSEAQARASVLCLCLAGQRSHAGGLP